MKILKAIGLLAISPIVLIIGALIGLSAILSSVTVMPSNIDCREVGAIVAPSDIKGVAAKGLDPKQLENAAIIMSIGQKRGFARQDIKIALQTGYQESELINLDRGHLDSRGVFQQRPSMNWGTEEQVKDPVYATNKFYDALEKVKSRATMDPFEVAMKVQIPSRKAYLSPTHNWNSWATMAEELLQSINLQAVSSVAKAMLYDDDCVDRSAPIAGKDGWQRPLDKMNVGSVFGQRFHPIRKIWKLHDGTDFPMPSGTPLYAMNNGTVAEAGFNTAEGNRIKIDYGDGQVVTYAHMVRPASVGKGVTVDAGKIVGYVGSTGFSTGAHLHLSWYSHGKAIDPVPELCKRGLPIAGPKGCGSPAAGNTTTCSAGASMGTATTAKGERISLCKVNGMVVNATIATKWQKLVDMAKADGFNLTGDGFRSADQQIAIRRENCGTSHYAIYEAPASFCNPYTAPPGESEHEKGKAVDVKDAWTYDSMIARWLQKNASSVGLKAEVPGESWHYSENGR